MPESLDRPRTRAVRAAGATSRASGPARDEKTAAKGDMRHHGPQPTDPEVPGGARRPRRPRPCAAASRRSTASTCCSALLEQPEGLVPRLLERMDVAARTTSRRPSSASSNARPQRLAARASRPGKIYVTPAPATAPRATPRTRPSASRTSTSRSSTSLLALLDEGAADARPAASSPQAGVTRDTFLAALTAVRGNQRVTSANPEATYEALEKYGVDLVAQARQRQARPGDRPRRRDPPRRSASSRARPRTTRC